MKKKLLGIFLASLAILTAIGASGIANPAINAAPGEVTNLVTVSVTNGQAAYSIVSPVDTAGRPVITTSNLPVEISHTGIYRLEVFDCYGSEIATCPGELTPVATINLDGSTGLATANIDLSLGGPGVHRIFVLGYNEAGVAIDGGRWVEVEYRPEQAHEPELILQSVNGQEMPDDHRATISSNEVELTLSYSNVQDIEIFDGDQRLPLSDCVVSNSSTGTLRCKFELTGGTNGVTHYLTVRYRGLDGEWYQQPLVLTVDDLGVPGTGLLKIGDVTIGREDLFVSILVVVLAAAVAIFYFVLRHSDKKKTRKR